MKRRRGGSLQFEFYVLNYNFNQRKVEMYNIFNNIHVQEHTEKAVRKYLRNSKKFSYTPLEKGAETIYGFDALVREIEGIIRWKEWARVEYECSVGYAFETDCNKLEKIDCYYQARANIEMIAREVIYQYKKQNKKGEDNND